MRKFEILLGGHKINGQLFLYHLDRLSKMDLYDNSVLTEYLLQVGNYDTFVRGIF